MQPMAFPEIRDGSRKMIFGQATISPARAHFFATEYLFG